MIQYCSGINENAKKEQFAQSFHRIGILLELFRSLNLHEVKCPNQILENVQVYLVGLEEATLYSFEGK